MPSKTLRDRARSGGASDPLLPSNRLLAAHAAAGQPAFLAIRLRHAVRVKFLTYKGTMQEVCLRLMGKKMLVAPMMEGKFSGEGLQSLDSDEDLMSAMARELVEKAGVGESADAIWRQLDRERSKHITAVPTAEVGPQNIERAPEPVAHTEPSFEATIHLAHSGSRRKRKNAPP